MEIVIKFDCTVVDWELTNENIEARREELNCFGIVVVHARHEDITRVEVVANCDIPGPSMRLPPLSRNTAMKILIMRLS